MPISKEPEDIKTTRSFLNQLIDVIQEDISASVSRRSYQVFVTGGIGDDTFISRTDFSRETLQR